MPVSHTPSHLVTMRTERRKERRWTRHPRLPRPLRLISRRRRHRRAWRCVLVPTGPLQRVVAPWLLAIVLCISWSWCAGMLQGSAAAAESRRHDFPSNAVSLARFARVVCVRASTRACGSSLGTGVAYRDQIGTHYKVTSIQPLGTAGTDTARALLHVVDLHVS